MRRGLLKSGYKNRGFMTFLRSHFISSACVGQGSFNNDGTLFLQPKWMPSKTIETFELSTPYDLSTITSVRNWVEGRLIYFASNGQYAYINNAGYTTLTRYFLLEPYNTATASISETINITSSSMTISQDGFKLLVFHQASSNIKRYNLSTSYNLSTAIESSSFHMNVRQCAYSTDGHFIYTLQSYPLIGWSIKQYKMKVAYDISNLVEIPSDIVIDSYVTLSNFEGMSISEDGLIITITSYNLSPNAFQFELSVPWMLPKKFPL